MLLYCRILKYEKGLNSFQSSTLALFNLKILVPFYLLHWWLSAAANSTPDPKLESLSSSPLFSWLAQQKHHKTIFQTSLLNGLLHKAWTYICLNTHNVMRKSPLHTIINNWYSILYSLKILKNKISFSITNRDTNT